MKIDGNELAILQNDLDREGKKEEALEDQAGISAVRCANPVTTARARRRAAIMATASSA